MAQALDLARLAADDGEVPVGAIVVHKGRMVGRGRNEVGASLDPTAHAEMTAMRDAVRALGTARLVGATLYSTLEPCAMCAGAAVLARIDRIVFGAHDLKSGAAVTLYAIPHDPRLNHQCDILGGVMDGESVELLRDYFKGRR